MSVAAASTSHPLDLSNPVLRVVQEDYTLCLIALPPKTELPAYIHAGGDDDDDDETSSEQPFYSLTRTREEISILATQELADEIVDNLPHGLQMLDEVTRWAVFRIQGPLDLSMVGVLHKFSEALRDGGVPLFVSSTFKTDYILVPEAKATQAREALTNAGWQF